MIEIGKKLPNATLFKLGEKGIDGVDSLEYVSGKKVILVGVPGAFTPTCSLKQMPGFVEKADEILSKNVDEIICVSVTNPFVMKAFITKGFVTETHIISSTFFDKISSAFSTKPGICFKEQVGVKAPGTPTKITFLPETYSSESTPSIPFSPNLKRVAFGNFFPISIILVS